MKSIALFAAGLLLAAESPAQDLVSKKFFSGKYGEKELEDSSSKATRVQTISRNADGSVTREWTALPGGVVLRTETRLGAEPVGHWVYRNKNGAVEHSFDYDFPLPKGGDTCTGFPNASTARRALPGDGAMLPDPLRMADGRALTAFLADVVYYPDDAREAGVEGRVVLNGVLNEDGRLENLVVVRSVHPALDKEAARVVRTARFVKPMTADGKPTRYCVKIPLKFTLE